MKTFLKILLYFILFIVVAALVTPLLFKKQILQIASEQANNNLNAKVAIADVKLSMFKRFPNLYVGLKGVSVVGVDQFDGDTLVSFDAFEVNVNLISAIKMDSIKVKGISLINPVMNAIILEDGTANWDIAKESDEIEEEVVEPEDSAGVAPQIKLKKFEIQNARISYTDKEADMAASLDGLNFSLSGDMSQSFTTLLLNLDITKVNFIMEGMKYLKDVRLNFLADIAADLENSEYTINKNELSLNELTLGLEGKVTMKGEDIITDTRFYTTNTSFKTLLSMVPAIYMKDFEDVETKGELKLDGTVIGTVGENILPVVNLELKVANAMFNYPDLPKQVDNINIGVKVKYHGVFEDSTTVSIDKFHLEIADNPVDLEMYIKTPMTDMHVNGNLKANLELASLADAVPMEGTTLSGKVISNIDIMGYLSSIENEEYEKFKADGKLQLKDLKAKSTDLDYDVNINDMVMLFSPKFVDLQKFDIKIGESDIQLKGKLENFIPYVFADKTVKGSLDFTSSYLNLNQFMTEDTSIVEVTEEVEDTTAMAVIEVPKNIDFALKTNLAKVIYDKMTIDDITGMIIVKDGTVGLKSLNMNTLGGFVNVSGEYNTNDIENPFVDLDLAMTEIDISSTVEAFNTIEKLAPISKHAFGNITTSFTYTSFLEENMKPRMKSIVCTGLLKSKSIKIENAKTFNAIGEKLGSDKFKELTLNDLDLDFDIRDGVLAVKPFETKLGKGKAMIGGNQSLDKSLDFDINLTMPRSYLGEGANSTINSLASNATAKGLQIDQNEDMNFGIKLGGTVTDPKVIVDLKSNAKKAVQVAKENIVNRAKEESQKRIDDTKAKANAEAQRILDNAEKQSQQVMQRAKIAADKTKQEYYGKANQLEKEASGKPKFARDLAKKAADKVRKEGDQKSAQIIKEAEAKSNKILEDARKEADKRTQ